MIYTYTYILHIRSIVVPHFPIVCRSYTIRFGDFARHCLSVANPVIASLHSAFHHALHVRNRIHQYWAPIICLCVLHSLETIICVQPQHSIIITTPRKRSLFHSSSFEPHIHPSAWRSCILGIKINTEREQCATMFSYLVIQEFAFLYARYK